MFLFQSNLLRYSHSILFIFQSCRLIISLPVYTQRLLVLLFGTFRVIASNSDRGQTGMTSEALGVSGKESKVLAKFSNKKINHFLCSGSEFLSKLCERWQKCTNGRRSTIQGTYGHKFTVVLFYNFSLVALDLIVRV